MHQVGHYISLWWKMAGNSFQASLTSRGMAIIFLVAKAIRFIMQFLLLKLVFTQTNRLSSYTESQILIFYLTFTLIDTITQTLFREVYRFRPLIVSGDFDFVLLKPMSPLFRVLLGGADPFDLLTLIPYTAILLSVLLPNAPSTIFGWIAYILLIGNGVLLAAAFHIFVLSMTIRTSEIDHSIMIYRDLTSIGRIPTDLYREPIRFLVTFVLPIGIMVSFPVQALLGKLSPLMMLLSVGISLGVFILSIQLWHATIREYSSASS